MSPHTIPVLPPLPLPAWMEQHRRPFHHDMYAMYSSAYGGIVTEPLLMHVPIDDHLVHRGDGVFETLKVVDGRIYCMIEHLDRLLYSALQIGLQPPGAREEIQRVILATLHVTQKRDALIRVILSRGPGGMGINPYECPSSHLYILVHKALPPFMVSHPDGARLITSAIAVKPGIFATIKTCNYLPNAMLKKEAIDRGADFAVNFDEAGFIAEGATENIGIVTPDQHLWLPPAGRILNGTTMNRAFELADTGITAGWLAGKGRRSLTEADLRSAAEILIFGTTTNVTAVTRLNGQPVGHGKPGMVQTRLNQLVVDEQTSDCPFTVHAFA